MCSRGMTSPPKGWRGNNDWIYFGPLGPEWTLIIKPSWIYLGNKSWEPLERKTESPLRRGIWSPSPPCAKNNWGFSGSFGLRSPCSIAKLIQLSSPLEKIRKILFGYNRNIESSWNYNSIWLFWFLILIFKRIDMRLQFYEQIFGKLNQIFY